ncbi:MAG: NADPH:quinone oxidoreductase [Polyangiaceae bacterium UTPRO1]|jgi:NADPH2:quinone reductase|nr:NADPH:quinone oxidoreductase family protein [Myxococcales bacterium]OQY65291.1 MAG: NADPH:quinone oxidoreductase [Polyangiaceae bacterium UTPRO1]
MRAVVCKEFGPPERLVVEELPTPAIGDQQVLLDVAACGVNFPDLLVIENKYQFKPPLPFTPGGEVAGVVKAVGAAVTTLKPGDRVLGAPGFGGFAEELAIDARLCVPIPEAMSFDVAAAFLFTYGTSHYALKDRARLAPGESLLVLGAAGGVGLAAVELGKAMGAKVIAAASSAAKLAVCREHGADEVIDYAREDLKERVKALTGGAGVDVVYDPVGGDFSEPALRAIAWEGRFLVIGFAAGPIPKIPLNLVLLKGAQIIGVFWGSFTVREPARHQANVRELMDWYVTGKLKPRISARYPFARVAEALNDLAERRVRGKVVLIP